MLKPILADYARQGYALLPLLPNAKRPHPQLVRDGLKSATADPETLERWAKAAPLCNWGVLPPEQVLVLDVDDPARWPELLAEYPELAEAPRQRTPRGGYHVWVRLPPGVDGKLSASTRKLAGMDLRGLGRAYLVAAPSAVDGKPYEWERPLLPPDQLPEVPSALLQQLLPAPPPAPRPAPAPAPVQEGDRLSQRLGGLLAWGCEQVAAAPEGTRHNTLLHQARLIGGWLHHGLDEHTALEALAAAAMSVGLPEDEARTTARDGLAHGKCAPLELPEGPRAYARLSLRPTGVEPPSSPLPDDAPWPELQPLPRKLPEAPSLPPEMVPEPLRDWLVQSAERACLPLEMMAVPALIAASGVVGRSVAVRPRDYSDWTVTPNLWGAIVAPPGAKKTDALLEALRPVTLLEEKARRAHEKMEIQARAEQALIKAQIQGAVAKAKKSGAASTSAGDVAALMERLEALESAPRKRYLAMDATVEKLGEILRDNPRGITLMRDELASWLAAMEQEEYAMARGFFLAAWSGNTGYSFDRIGRGTVHVPSACVALVGGIQPEPLQAVFERLRRDPARADGMVQRLQMLVWPDELPEWNPPQSWPDKAAREAAAELYARLDGLERRHPQNPSDVAPRLLSLEDEAKRLYAQWHDAHERRLRGSELRDTPHFASHVAKYGSLAASLAVIFHLLDFANRPHRWGYENDAWHPLVEPPPVTGKAVALALDWVEFLELHARKVYSSELQSEAQAAHRLADQIYHQLR